MIKEKAACFWSGGKDSAMALYKAKQTYNVKYLITTINKKFERITMHGIREKLLEKQVDSIGIPLIKMYVEGRSNKEYEKSLLKTLTDLKAQGITKIIFGDIFLEDLRKYREALLEKLGLEGVFPLWNADTYKLMNEFLELGFKTIICCVNEKVLSKSFSGKIINQDLIKDFPSEIDICGENGEYHTFCFDGPIFKYPVNFLIGETITRSYPDSEYIFSFCDLFPQQNKE